MADAKITCACGKQYNWKPDLAGRRARCKCGSVVAFPAQPPGAEDDFPEGFDDTDDFAVPPPPPPHAAAGGATALAPPPPPPRLADPAALPRGAMPASGAASGLNFSPKALWNLAIGVGLIAFGVFMYFDIAGKEADGDIITFGRRGGWLRLMYSIGGKWGVTGFFSVVGLGLIGFAVLVMLGKTAYKKDE